MRVIYLIPPLVGSRFSDAAASQVASLSRARGFPAEPPTASQLIFQHKAAARTALAPNLNFAHCGSPLF